MSSLIPPYILLAQLSRWRRLGDDFRQAGGSFEFSDCLPYLAGGLLCAAFIAIVVAVRRRLDFNRPCNDPQKLFRELSLAHGLDRPSQILLRQLAQVFQLSQPAEVFVTPQAFATERLPAQLQAEATRIAELRQRLF